MRAEFLPLILAVVVYLALFFGIIVLFGWAMGYGDERYRKYVRQCSARTELATRLKDDPEGFALLAHVLDTSQEQLANSIPGGGSD